MRRLLFGFVVAASAALVPTLALAGNQEVAEQIAANLRDSGQMRGYRVGVRYQDGTAWLRGQVANQEQMAAAMRIATQTPGVMRVVNNLTIITETAAAPAAADNRSLRQVDNALSAEQFQRPVTRDMRTGSAPRPSASQVATAPQPAAPQPARSGGFADRVASTFMPAPAQQVNAQEPTVAPPRLAGPTQNHMVVAYAQPPMAEAPAAPVPTGVAPLPPPVPAPAVPGAPEAPMAAVPTGAPLPMGAVAPMPMNAGAPMPAGAAPIRYDQPNLPNYAWPGYAAYPNYAALTYPKQYSPTAWPYIGPFYPYPQVPLGWRKVTLEWHDGWWNLDFDDGAAKGPFSGLFRGARCH